jgi:hypothetical protein
MGEFKQEWIAELSSPEASRRVQGAKQIYLSGRSLADSVVHTWRQNEDFVRLLGNDPQVTVGLAVRPETFAAIRQANGWTKLAKVPPEQDASEFELHFDGQISLDVLTSREPNGDGAIAKFLVKFGEGIQQVEFRCTDVDRAAAILRNKFGISPVYSETRPGANGTRVNFFLVPTADGKKILIELYESPAGSPTAQS